MASTKGKGSKFADWSASLACFLGLFSDDGSVPYSIVCSGKRLQQLDALRPGADWAAVERFWQEAVALTREGFVSNRCDAVGALVLSHMR